MSLPFAPGATIVIQEVWRGQLWSARPCLVVEDTDDRVLLWCPRGTIRKCATTPPWQPRAATRAERFVKSLSQGDWVLGDFAWDVSTLWLVPWDAWHAVWVSWRTNGDFMGWYVNLQEPFRRTAVGFQTMDMMLDIVVDPNREWHWKDRDEFQALIDNDLLDEETSRHVKMEAARAIDRINRNRPPFNEPWAKWRPDPSWPAPTLPDGWDHLEGET